MDLLLHLLIVPAVLTIVILFQSKVKTMSITAGIGMWMNVLLAGHLLFIELMEKTTFQNQLPGILYDRSSLIFILLTSVVTAAAMSQSGTFFKSEMAINSSISEHKVKLFYIFSILFHISMVLVFILDNMGYLWIAIETTTLLSAALVYFNRDKHALEAAWKYFIICSVGIAFALLGTVCFYISSKHGPIPGGTLNISELILIAPALETTFRKLGFIFCFLGYGTKAGVFPLHSWLPDAHSEAPAPASAMLSGALLNCALFAIYRLSQISHASNDGAFTQSLIIWSGALTIFAASLFLVRQHGIKRLWAYSSIENVGIMLVAIGFNATTIFLLHAINHSLAKVSLFLISGEIILHTKTKELARIKGLYSSMPIASTLLLISAIAITGAPPFGAFISEWMLLLTAAEASHWFLTGLIIVSLSIGFIMVCFHTIRILTGGTKRQIEYKWRPCLVPALLVTCTLILGITTGPHLTGILK